jgi:hypothetical protein
MDGIDQCIAKHVTEDALRAKMLACLIEFNNALGSVFNKAEFRSIWCASITPWDNKQGFDIRLRALPGNFDQLRDELVAKLKIKFEVINPREQMILFDQWRSDVKIYLTD